MARRRRKARRSLRRLFSAKRSRRSSSGPSLLNYALAGGVVGYVRPMVANMLPSVFSFGPVDSDNVFLAGAGYLLSKQTGMLKAMGHVLIANEVASVTQKAFAGSTTPTGTTGILYYG